MLTTYSASPPPRQIAAQKDTRKDSQVEPPPQRRLSKSNKAPRRSRDSDTGTVDAKDADLAIVRLPQRQAPRRPVVEVRPKERRTISPIVGSSDAGHTSDSAPATPFLKKCCKRADHEHQPSNSLQPLFIYGAVAYGSFAGGSPLLTEVLAPTAEVSINDPDYVPFRMPDDYHLPLDRSPDVGPLPDDHDIVDDNIEELLRTGQTIKDPQLAWAARYMAPLSSPKSSPPRMMQPTSGRALCNPSHCWLKTAQKCSLFVLISLHAAFCLLWIVAQRTHGAR